MSGRSRSEWLIAKSEARAERAMVTADQPAAAEAGLAMLREGGNAVDAAAAAAFAMGVLEPFTSGVGGVVCMVVRFPDGRATVIDGSTTAPLAAREDMFALAREGERAGMYGWRATAGNENNVGYRSLGVPGMVGALALALERYGTLPLRRVLEPAIALARDGFEIEWYLALAIAGFADRLWPHADSKRVFFKAGGLPPRTAMGLEPGDRVVQPDLARTLETIADEGPQAFYRGPLARAIADDARAHGGLLTSEDFAAFEPRELEPLTTEYRGHRVLTVPEASGGITLVEALNILEGFDLGALSQSGAESLHLLAEASRRAFLDRLAFLADPRAAAAPFSRLASKEYAAAVRGTIDPRRAAPNARPGALAIAAAGRALTDHAHTTHVCAIDADRTMVSLTSTLGQGFGSGVVARGTGVVLADVMTWFDPVPGRPNSIGPGKRILWAPAPAIVLRGGRPFAAVGSPGGRKLITAVLQTLVNLVDHRDGPQDAVNRPRVHSEGSETWIEARVPAPVRDSLAAMGHQLVVKEETLSSTWFGRPNAIVVDGAVLRAGVNRLKPSLAVGY